MHQLLGRLLKDNGLSKQKGPDAAKWKKIIESIERICSETEKEKKALEQMLEISSRETREILESSSRLYEEKMSILLKVIPDVLCYMDEEGRFLDIFSDGKDNLLLKPRDELMGKLIKDVMDDETSRIFMQASKRALGENRLNVINYSIVYKHSIRFCEARIMPTNIIENNKKTVITIIRDITAQKKSNEYLNVIKKIFEDATEGIWIASLKDDTIEANNSFCRMLDISCDWVEESGIGDYVRFFDPDQFLLIKDSVIKRRYYHGEVLIRNGRKNDFPVWLIVDTIYSDEGEAVYLVAMLTDISELRASREELYYTSTHDALTGLPNRRKLFESIDNTLQRYKRSGKSGALLFLDLDNFKEVNDIYGHKAGDDVLRDCAKRVESITRETDVFGRLGGDEFLLIAENVDSPSDVVPIAKKIQDIISEPFRIGDAAHSLGVSIGIAIFPHDSMERDELLRRADIAMYQAKQEGKNRYRFYSNTLDRNIKKYYMIETALRTALEKNGFYLLFQPQIELSSSRITSLEVLLRIDENIAGLLSPDEFIPIAERSDLISKIGKWVFISCCRQLKQWKEKDDLKDIVLSINVSRRHLVDDGWIDFVKKSMKHYGIRPESIEFEITEEALISAKKTGQKIVSELRKAGFRISIDDFGTGYSSLSVLKGLDISKLKIDRSFIEDISNNDNDRAIVKASIALANAFGISTVAEGVETDEQKEIIMEMGCRELQGFLYSVPRSAKEITALLKSNLKFNPV